MQYAILIGALISGLVIGGTLLQFNNAGTVYSEKMLPVLTLSDQEMALLVDKETHKEKDYLIFDTRNDLLTRTATPARKAELEAIAKDKPGAYLVGVTTKKIEILKDPGIMGVLENRDDGSRVNREFAAPKTQVMGIIINGVLKRDLNWSMVAMGAIIALVLDMCGVSALAFAVGIYVPIAVSAPIFAGGLVRAGVDHFVTRRARAILANAQTEEEKAAAELEILKHTETSPGVLLASGYIAGGSIAGVVLAFFAFSDTLPKDLAQWQYPTWTAPHAGSLAKLAEEAAKERLGKDATPEELKAEIQRVVDLNEEEGIPARLITVPVGTKIFDLSGKENEVKEATTLGQLARTLAGREYLAGNLFKVNTDKGIKLTKMETIPAGTTLLMPQPAWPALVAFGGLALLLCLVGWGYLIPGGKTQS